MNTVASDNQRQSNMTGIAAMIGSQALFVANDTCVKLAGETLPVGEIILVRNGAATLYVVAFAAVMGGLTLPESPPIRKLGWRMAAEALSTLFFLSALVAMPIGDANAIAQFMPLAMTAAAAIYLKEHVGLRRWTAALSGLIGVLLIMKPGTSTFNPAALLVLCAVATVIARDLLTRQISTAVPTLTLTLMSAASVAPMGLLLFPFEHWVWPQLREWALLSVAGAFLTIAYALIIVAMRAGNVAVVTPFRYSVILFSLLSGWLLWGDLPDAPAILGIAILSFAGVYTVHRERMMLKMR